MPSPMRRKNIHTSGWRCNRSAGRATIQVNREQARQERTTQRITRKGRCTMNRTRTLTIAVIAAIAALVLSTGQAQARSRPGRDRGRDEVRRGGGSRHEQAFDHGRRGNNRRHDDGRNKARVGRGFRGFRSPVGYGRFYGGGFYRVGRGYGGFGLRGLQILVPVGRSGRCGSSSIIFGWSW